VVFAKTSEILRVRDLKILRSTSVKARNELLGRGKSIKAKTKREKMNCAQEIGQRDRMTKQVSVAVALVVLSLAGIGCRQAATAKQPELPKESYERPPGQL
jgi:hypothetical protein